MPSHVGQYLGWRNAALTGCDDNRYSGNFCLQPNGVFLIDNQGARVLSRSSSSGYSFFLPRL